jgi:hypothetical protein
MHTRTATLLIALVIALGLVTRAEGATWNLIVPGETHFGEVSTRLGIPTIQMREERMVRGAFPVVRAAWEGSDAPKGTERVEVFFGAKDLLARLIVVYPVKMPRSEVHKEYGPPGQSWTTEDDVLVDRYPVLGMAATYQADGQTVRTLEFFEGVRGRYGR